MSFVSTDHIAKISLEAALEDETNPQVKQDRAIAIADLIEESKFVPVKAKNAGVEGPYKLHLSRIESRLLFEMTTENGDPAGQVLLSLTPFRKSFQNYQGIIESYFQALRANPAKIEAIDMARRGLHNEVAELLIERLSGKIDIDFDTSRRLITLILALEVKTSQATPPVVSTQKKGTSVLFVCTRNAVRSAMAEAMLKERVTEEEIYVDSAGLDPSDVDGFAVAVLKEQNLQLARHNSKEISTIHLSKFDAIITLSPQAEARVATLVKDTGIKHLNWIVDEPDINPNSRDMTLASYRKIRDRIAGLLDDTVPALVG